MVLAGQSNACMGNVYAICSSPLSVTSEPDYEVEFQHLLRGSEKQLHDRSIPKYKGLTNDKVLAMMRLTKLPAFKGLPNFVASDNEFFNWIEEVSPEHDVPHCWNETKPFTGVGKALHRLLVIQAFRPDRLLAATHIFVSSIMGEQFMLAAESELDLANIVENEVKPSTPVLMCSVIGYDASGRLDDLAAEQGKQITSIAIGSAEGFSLADKCINSASKSGRWVMLKNVHLAPQWLVTLEKKLHTLSTHPGFRLFLTMEINPKVPVNLLRAGRIFVFEPPPGVKANLLRTFSAVPAARMCKAPNERARLYFLLAWFHAIIQERLRYVPLGWSKKYEFNESDLRCACDTLDVWIDTVAKGRSNLPPDKVPWDALRTLFSQSIYGGRIDNDFDQRLLTTFIKKLFTAKSYESDFALVEEVDGVKGRNIRMPDGIRREQYLQFIEKLPEQQTPSWLGLPNNAEKVLLTNRGSEMITNLLKMQLLEDDDDLAYTSSSHEEKPTSPTGDGRPAWMRSLQETAFNWLSLIPKVYYTALL
ncbi:cytoplasmic dynein 1 heavy chain 1-like [Saccoglossus kowalevskii]